MSEKANDSKKWAAGDSHPSRGVSGALKRDLGGTFRACDPVETLARVRPLFPALGITRVADVTGLDRIGIPVAMCVRPNGRLLAVSQGKGVTRDLAWISAIMESVEHYHAEYLRPVGRKNSIDPTALSFCPGL